MIESITNHVKGYNDIEVPYTFSKMVKSSKSVVILLPGASNTTSSPLFHYSTGLFLNKNYDVLAVNYQYNQPVYDGYSNEEICEANKIDVNTVLTAALKNKCYENIVFIAKSLGTVALASEINRDIFSQAKAVWLTPLIHREDVFNAMINNKNSGLSIIGDKDRYFTENRYNRIKQNNHITSHLIANVNHSLEYEYDAIGSIDVLKNIMKEISNYA